MTTEQLRRRREIAQEVANFWLKQMICLEAYSAAPETVLVAVQSYQNWLRFIR